MYPATQQTVRDRQEGSYQRGSWLRHSNTSHISLSRQSCTLKPLETLYLTLYTWHLWHLRDRSQCSFKFWMMVLYFFFSLSLSLQPFIGQRTLWKENGLKTEGGYLAASAVTTGRQQLTRLIVLMKMYWPDQSDHYHYIRIHIYIMTQTSRVVHIILTKVTL